MPDCPAPLPHSGPPLFVWNAPSFSSKISFVSSACRKKSCPVFLSLSGFGLGMALVSSPVAVSRLYGSLSHLLHQAAVGSVATFCPDVAVFSTTIAECVVFPFS